VRQCRPRPPRDRRGGRAPADDAGLRAVVPDGPSDRLRFRRAAGRDRAGAPGLDRVFFTNSGSESVDTALKIALAYQRAIGQASRTRLIGRERGYHGVGFGGISVGGMVNNRRAFPQLPGTDHSATPTISGRNAFSKGLPSTAPNSPTISSGWSRCMAPRPSPPSSSSRWPARPACCRRRRAIWSACAICDKHGILLIFDEVITGFGRLGTPFADRLFRRDAGPRDHGQGPHQRRVPMGAVFASRKIYDA
jgi:beta-alanine--pyruvate transaminase